jgi:hypothetical protein
MFEQVTGKPIMSSIVDKINGNVDQIKARQAQEEKENRFIEKLNRGGMNGGGINQLQNTLNGGAQNASTPPGNGAPNAGGKQNNGGQKQDDKMNNQASDTIKQSLQNQQQAKQQPQQQQKQQESDKHK